MKDPTITALYVYSPPSLSLSLTLSLSHFISHIVLNEIVCNAIESSLKQVIFFKTKTNIHDDEVLAIFYIIIEFSPFIIK